LLQHDCSDCRAVTIYRASIASCRDSQ